MLLKSQRTTLFTILACAMSFGCGDDHLASPAPTDGAAQSTVALASTQAPLHKALGEEGLPNHYIVKLRDDLVPRSETQARVEDLLMAIPGSDARDVWPTFRGFYGEIPAVHLETLLRNPLVEYVEEDEIIYEDEGTVLDPASSFAFPSGTQSSPWWHLDRIDEDSYPLDGSYAYDNSGDGVRIYVIDTGIRQTHNEFGSRADILYEADTWSPSDTDCHGHGTRIASAAAGATYGVAKDATLIGVRVNDCSLGANKGHIISGIEWVANNHVKPAVANLSYKGANNLVQSVSDAVEDLVDAGVMLTKSAGNDDKEACGESEMHDDPGVFVVGAMELNTSDVKWSDSNWGSCLDVYAPGASMRLAGIGSDSDTDDVAGTSYAAPLAAGVAAAYLEDYPNDSPATVHAALRGGSTQTSVSGDASVGRVLYANVPRMHPVSWSGPSTVKPSDVCVWEAETLGGRQPYSYSWSGVLTGSGRTISGSISSSGWLYLDVDDSAGETKSYQAFVTVDSGAPSGCPE